MKDLWYNIVLFCDTESLKNLYMTNQTCHKLLNEQHTLKQLSIKFNNPSTNFKNFYATCGQFMMPSLQQKIRGKWVTIKQIHQNGSYITQFNGDEKYRIHIEDKIVNVYDNTKYCYTDSDDFSDSDEYNDFENSTLLKTYYVKQFFVGKSYKTETTRYSETANSHNDGNSILLYINNNEYVYINNRIHTFNSYGKIINFYAPVGNNDVPYPYAVDEYNNIYIMSEEIMIPMTLELMSDMADDDDPSYYYYTHENMNTYKL
jgi:hypothetical protein